MGFFSLQPLRTQDIPAGWYVWCSGVHRVQAAPASSAVRFWGARVSGDLCVWKWLWAGAMKMLTELQGSFRSREHLQKVAALALAWSSPPAQPHFCGAIADTSLSSCTPPETFGFFLLHLLFLSRLRCDRRPPGTMHLLLPPRDPPGVHCPL